MYIHTCVHVFICIYYAYVHVMYVKTHTCIICKYTHIMLLFGELHRTIKVVFSSVAHYCFDPVVEGKKNQNRYANRILPC